MSRPTGVSNEKYDGRMPGRTKLQIALGATSLIVAVVFLTIADSDRWLQLVGGVGLLFIALCQVFLVMSTERTK